MKELTNKVKDCGRKLAGGIKTFWNDESGMGTVEVILIIVVLIGLVVVFKKQISGIVEDVFKTIREETRAVTN
jgi:Flp pilus assembly pilin Flp